MFSVTFDRSYRDEKSQHWKCSSSFSRNNLPTLARLAEQAFDWVQSQPKATTAA
jgi:hypothetical protein